MNERLTVSEAGKNCLKYTGFMCFSSVISSEKGNDIRNRMLQNIQNYYFPEVQVLKLPIMNLK